MKIIESGGIQQDYNIQWLITKYCNYDCYYCTAHERFNKDKLKFFNYDSIKKYIKIIDNLPINNNLKILISGGEPTLHPNINDIFEVLFEQLNNTLLIMLHTNLSLNIDKLIELISVVDKKRFMLFTTFHAKFADYYDFQKKIDILNKYNIKYNVSIMLEPDEFDKIFNFVNKFKTNNNEEVFKNLKLLPLEPIEYKNYDSKFLGLEKLNYTLDKLYSPIKDVYYIIEKDNTIIKEEYYLSEVRKLPKFYHNFQGMKCYKYNHLIINPDGTINARCDNYDCYKKKFLPFNKSIKELYNNIDKPFICHRSSCPDRDDLRFIKKFR